MSVRTIDIAYDYLKSLKHSATFKELWEVVRTELNFDDSQARRKMSQFYTDLSLDGRFTALANNEWDLKSNHKFDEVFIDTEKLVDEDSDDEDEDSGGSDEEEEELDLDDELKEDDE